MSNYHPLILMVNITTATGACRNEHDCLCVPIGVESAHLLRFTNDAALSANSERAFRFNGIPFPGAVRASRIPRKTLSPARRKELNWPFIPAPQSSPPRGFARRGCRFHPAAPAGSRA